MQLTRGGRHCRAALGFRRRHPGSDSPADAHLRQGGQIPDDTDRLGQQRARRAHREDDSSPAGEMTSMPEPHNHPAAASVEELNAECDVRRLRRSGPGGQHRNKVETAVALQHLPSGVRAEANERRSQAQNHSLALFRLRVNLALEVRLACGADYVPSPLWQARCGGGAMKLSAENNDFPALLAEALDVLAALDFEPKSAAA